MGGGEVVAGIFLAMMAALPANAQPSIALVLQSPALNAGTNPIAIATGDLDGDGNVDLAVANSDSNDVSIFWGNGDGTFTAATATLPVGTAPMETPVAIAIASVSGHTYPDIITANETADTVSVLPNLGGRNFGAAIESPTGTGMSPMSPEAVVVADFNGDHVLDVATPNLLDDSVTVLLGKGNGNFTPLSFCSNLQTQICGADSDCAGGGTCTAQPIPVGSEPDALVAVDLNKDGFIDLVVANSSGGGVDMNGSIMVLKGAGDGTFAAQAEITSTTFDDPVAIAVGQGPTDLNGDQDPDLVVVNDLGDSLSLLLGKGDLTFQDAVALNIPNEFTAQVAAASAGATALELQTVPPGFPIWGTITMIGSQAVNIAFTRSGNTLTLTPPIPSDVSAGTTITAMTPSIPEAAVIADFNGDGKPDIATSASLQDKVSVFAGLGSGAFAVPVDFALVVGSTPFGLATDDFDKDGHPDLATADLVQNGTVSILLNASDVTLAGNIGATDTTLTVSNADPFPSSGTIVIDQEQITYTGKTGNQLTGLTRGANGATAAPHSAGAAVILQLVPTPTCVGDCNGNNVVTVDEILTIVDIALGNAAVSSCEAGDANHDGQITVDEILTVVNNALIGCTK